MERTWQQPGTYIETGEAMKAVGQARLELSGVSTPDHLWPWEHGCPSLYANSSMPSSAHVKSAPSPRVRPEHMRRRDPAVGGGGGQRKPRDMTHHLHLTLCCPFSAQPHAPRDAYGRGSPPLHNPVSDSANPSLRVTSATTVICGVIIELSSSDQT